MATAAISSCHEGTSSGSETTVGNPNLWWLDSLTLGARRDIEVGEEVTTDYATSTAVPGFRMTCSCGSENCRHIITGEDWNLESLRNSHGAHWTAAFRARF